MANEIKQFYFGSQASPVASGNVEAGDFTLTFAGQTTGSIAFNSDAAAITTALEALSNIGVGDVLVTLTADGFTVEFQGALANTNVGDLTCTPSLKQKADTINVAVDQVGAGPTDEIQTITNALAAASGGFDLDGITVTLDGSDDLADIQAALDTIFGGGNTSTSVAGNFVDVIVQFTGSLVATDVAEMSVSNDTTGQSVGVTTTQAGSSGQQHILTISLPDAPTEGGFKLEHATNLSSEIGYDAVGSTVSSALASLVGQSFTESDPFGMAPWTISSTFNLADPGTISGVEETALRKACPVEIVTTQEGEGGGGGSGAARRRRILI